MYKYILEQNFQVPSSAVLRIRDRPDDLVHDPMKKHFVD